MAGYRPQPLEIHIDPALNSLDSAEWNPESNDIPRVIATWRTGGWGQVKMKFNFIDVDFHLF